MHILVYSQSYAPENNAPATRLVEHAAEWVANGHKVTVITSLPVFVTGDYKNQYCNKVNQQEIIRGVNVIRVWTWRKQYYKYWGRIFKYLCYPIFALLATKQVERVDIIISTSPDLFCGLTGYIAKKIFAKPWVLEIRDLWPDSIRAVGAIKSEFLFSLLNRVEKKIYLSADSVVAVTQGVADHIEGIRKKRDIILIPNAVNTKFFVRHDNFNKQNLNFNFNDKFIISYCGTIGLAQNLKTILFCAERLLTEKDILFVLMGDGVECANLMSYTSEKKLHNVKFIKNSSKETVRDLYSVSDLALVCLAKDSIFDTAIPSKIFEAMAMECPIIFSGSGEAEKLIIKADCGIVAQAENVSAICDAILYFKSAPHEKVTKGQQGRNFIIEKYQRKNMAIRYLQLLGNVIAGKN